MTRGIVPLAGIDDGLAAVEAAADVGQSWASPLPLLEGLRPLASDREVVLTEWETKQRLSGGGRNGTAGRTCQRPGKRRARSREGLANPWWSRR